MDHLRNLVASKRQEIKEVKGEKKWMSRADIEKLREEEIRKSDEVAEEKRRLAEAERLRKLDDFLEEEARRKNVVKLRAQQEDQTAVTSTAAATGAEAPAADSSHQVSGEGEAPPTGRAETVRGREDGDGGEVAACSGDREVASTVGKKNESSSDEPPLSVGEVCKKLRKLGEPITLFGESNMRRYMRLCQVEVNTHEDELMGGQQNVMLELLASDSGKGTKRRCARPSFDGDDFLGDLDSADDADGLEVPPQSSATATDASVSQSSQNTTPLPPGGRVGQAEASEGDGAAEVTQEDEIRLWIRGILAEWEEELRERPDEVKKGPNGRMLTAQHRQTRRDLRPLLKKLKERQLEEAVLVKLHAMVKFCEEKEYVKAHDKYIELAIGNAAWPMGVTMVGIHERAGRSKIFTSEIAHILNDETTRKYIQMFKRLMTICQRRRPTDPSRMVSMSTTHV